MLEEANLEEQIRLRAYALWQAAGEPGGGSEHFWHQAKHEITDEKDGSSEGTEEIA